MELQYPQLRHHLVRDSLVVWIRWVSMEKPASPDEPTGQGIRAELLLNRNSVMGPTITYRRDLDTPVYMRANRARTAEIMRQVGDGGMLDIGLVIHGSIANAPYVALYQVRDYDREAIDTRDVPGTPLLQLQPSTPAQQWHVAGHTSMRVRLALEGLATHLKVVR